MRRRRPPASHCGPDAANRATLSSPLLSPPPPLLDRASPLPEPHGQEAEPAIHRAYRTKPEIALAEIDRLRRAGVRFGCILADAGYGLSAPFRQGLSERGLAWAAGIPFKQKAYCADVPSLGARPPAPAPHPRYEVDYAQAMLETV